MEQFMVSKRKGYFCAWFPYCCWLSSLLFPAGVALIATTSTRPPPLWVRREHRERNLLLCVPISRPPSTPNGHGVTGKGRCWWGRGLCSMELQTGSQQHPYPVVMEPVVWSHRQGQRQHPYPVVMEPVVWSYRQGQRQHPYPVVMEPVVWGLRQG